MRGETMYKNNSKKQILFVVCLILILMISGCGKQKAEDTQTENAQIEDTETEADPVQKTGREEVITTEDITEISTEATDVADASTILAGLPTFIFASGAGAWDTTLTIYEDGTFEGYFHDSDMGDTGEGYENGTVYVCEFHGSFTDIKKVNDYTYSMQLRTIELTEEPGKEWIEDGILFVTEEPYGLVDAEEVLLYLPGAPTAELPEEFVRWIAMPNGWSEDNLPAYLDNYGLYNVNAESGFYGY